jgi:LPXTG-motif cell wall-anchored protein
MKQLRTISAIVSFTAFSLVLAPRINADEWSKRTTVTFNEPVEIPGQVLSAGTYVFKLMDSQSDRNIVQIFNKKENHIYATILAIPDYRLKPTGKTVITFEERAADSPQAIKAWFYPGDNYGQEFVYPKVRAAQLAKVVKQPVPSMPANMEPTTKMAAKSPSEPQVVAMKKAPVKAQQPTGEEVEIGEVVTTPPQLVAQNTAPAPDSKTLPSTGSSLPLIALVGLILTTAGLGLRFAARKIN